MGIGQSNAKVNLISHNRLVNIKVVIALGIHLFPFRTEKLSPMAPMVLHTTWESR